MKVPADALRALHHHRRRAGPGVGVVACRTGTAQRLARRQRREHPDSRVEVLQLPARRPAAGVLAQLVERTRGRRRPVGRSGAGVLGARRTADALESGGAAFRPGHLPPSGDAAAPHPAEGPVTGQGCRRRAREGIGTSSAVGGHHGRRKPQGIRPIRDPARHPGDRTGRASPARAGVQVATADQTRDAGVRTLP